MSFYDESGEVLSYLIRETFLRLFSESIDELLRLWWVFCSELFDVFVIKFIEKLLSYWDIVEFFFGNFLKFSLDTILRSWDIEKFLCLKTRTYLCASFQIENFPFFAYDFKL